MAVSKRRKSVTDFYHVIIKGINNEMIFGQSREKIYFKSIILKKLSKYQIEVYSYCIMSNHAHFIIRAKLSVLSKFMASILAEYAVYYNYKHNRNGHVFQNRFRSECIENENYFWTCLRYIHLNPVKVKMVKKAENYKYSSMLEYVSGTNELVAINAVEFIKNKFTNKKEFLKFHVEKQQMFVEDIPQEAKMQQEELAFTIAEMLKDEYHLALLSRVVEEKNMREIYKMKMQTILGVSKRRSNELCRIIKNKIENKHMD